MVMVSHRILLSENKDGKEHFLRRQVGRSPVLVDPFQRHFRVPPEAMLYLKNPHATLLQNPSVPEICTLTTLCLGNNKL